VLLLLDQVADLPPLLLGWVNTGRVVGAGVEEDGGTVGDGLLTRRRDQSKGRKRGKRKEGEREETETHTKVLLQPLKVQPNRLLVVVRVVLDLKPGVLEDRDVVPPSRGGDVDLLRAGEVAGEEGAGDAEGTGTGEGLGDGDLLSWDENRMRREKGEERRRG
jgi:hypothetical protein